MRAEKLKSPQDFIQDILDRIPKIYITRNYNIQSWNDSHDFLTQLAKVKGKLLKGGEPDINNVSVSMINDWQRVILFLYISFLFYYIHF